VINYNKTTMVTDGVCDQLYLNSSGCLHVCLRFEESQGNKVIGPHALLLKSA
jgi:hypothetical protein